MRLDRLTGAGPPLRRGARRDELVRLEDVEASVDVAVAQRVVKRAAGMDPGVYPGGRNIPVALLMQHRVLPLFAAGQSQTVEVHQRLRAIAMVQLKLRAALADVLGLLGDRASDVRVIKGLASSELDYETPALRHTGDVDLLVRPAAYDAVSTSLRTAGLVVKGIPNVPDDLQRGLTYVHSSGVEIDLHRAIGPVAGRSIESMFLRPQPLTVGTAPPSEVRLVIAAMRFLQTPPGARRLSGLADVSALARSVDPEQLRSAAAQHGAEGLVRAALDVVATTGGPDIDRSDLTRPSRIETVALLQQTRQPLVLERLYWASTIDSVGGRLRFARGLVSPPAVVTGESEGRRRYYSRHVRSALDRFER